MLGHVCKNISSLAFLCYFLVFQIEPNPTYWYNLTRHRPNCHIVGAVVGQERMEQVYFTYWEREHGGIAGEGFDNGPRHQKSSTTEYTVTFQEILHRFQAPKVIDYLSLDVEGAEYFIMKAFPLHEYTIRILTIERPKDELKKLLEQHGYKQILRLSRWGETLWIHSAFERRMDLSRLPEFHGKKQWEQQKARVAAALAESHP
jgi:Methyltransferase FkbM domain